MFSKFIQWLKDLFKKPVQAPALPEVPPAKELPPSDADYKSLPWMKLAYSYVGVHEIAGPKSHPKIAEWLKAVGQNGSDEIAWCAAFANAVLREAGYKHTKRATARSLLDLPGKLDHPKPGSIVVFWRGSIQGWQGHVGFVEKVSSDGRNIRVLGGNQSDEVNSSWYSVDRVLGYRWPEKT